MPKPELRRRCHQTFKRTSKRFRKISPKDSTNSRNPKNDQGERQLHPEGRRSCGQTQVNLLSVSQLIDDGYETRFKKNACRLLDSAGELVFAISRVGESLGLIFLNLLLVLLNI